MNWREMLPKWHPLHKEPEPTQTPDQFSFCEGPAAGSQSRWHIRQLTRRGKMLGGGADTPALCGHQVSWDLSVVIDPRRLQHACPRCTQIYRERTS